MCKYDIDDSMTDIVTYQGRLKLLKSGYAVYVNIIVYH